MGLCIHLGAGGLNNLGEYLGSIDIDELDWLQKNELVLEGRWGHYPDDPAESLPYYDDVRLSPEQVKSMYDKFSKKADELKRTPGFKSEALDKLEMILLTALERNEGLSTVAD